MKSKRTLFLAFAFLIVASAAHSAQEAILTALSGKVEIRSSKTSDWQGASKGAQLSEGAGIRTGADGRAVVLFKNGTKVWVKEKTTFDLTEQKARAHQVYLREGAIKVRVPHLKFRETFKLRTLTSVTAVRGTILTLEADSNGQPFTNVLFGEVKLDRTDPDSDRPIKSMYVPQGNGYENGKVSLLTSEQEVLGLEDWSPGLTQEERRKDLIDNVKKRAEVRQFAAMTRAVESEIAESQQQMKEEDFAAGRTLVDVHGNLVRVDQRLDRPDGKTIQILNVVKRTGYASGGFRRFSYQGGSGARIDSLRAKVEFDKVLPENINEFPGFFSKNDDTIHVERSEMVLASFSDADSVFTIAMMGLRNTSTNDISPDLFIGTLDNSGGTSGRTKLFQLRQQSDLNVAGLTRFVEDTSVSSISQDGASGELYGNFAKRWYQSGTPAQKLWLTSEFFVINNAGSVRNLSDFISGSTDFEALLKNSAVELGVFAKADAANVPSATDAINFSGGNAAKRNVDIVFIPDIMVSVVKSMASSLSSISKSLDSSFDSVSNAKK